MKKMCMHTLIAQERYLREEKNDVYTVYTSILEEGTRI
jgi:hypothetical protein